MFGTNIFFWGGGQSCLPAMGEERNENNLVFKKLFIGMALCTISLNKLKYTH